MMDCVAGRLKKLVSVQCLSNQFLKAFTDGPSVNDLWYN